MLHILRKFQRPIALFILFTFGLTFIPNIPSYALTSGPGQPETQQFAPAGMDNMVDPFTGDFSYNIPLMDVGGYPINLNYAGGITPDAEASWVGLGWNVNVGAMNRSMRGLPDDFKGEQIAKTYNVKPNQTFSLDIAWKDEAYGANLGKVVASGTKNITVTYNTYNGFGASFGIAPKKSLKLFEKGPFTSSLGGSFSLGSEEGFGFTPKLSLGFKKKGDDNDATFNTTTSLPYNTRDGLKGVSFGASVPSSASQFKKWGLNDQGELGRSFMGFSTPSYTPGIPHDSYNVNIDLGLSWSPTGTPVTEFKSYDITGYYAGQFLENTVSAKPGYGYLYAGNDNSDSKLLDFNREKDGTYDKNTKNLALTSVTHDIFAASGQGAGGTYRLFRSDVGTVNDPAGKESGYSPSVAVDLDFGVANLKVGVDLKYTQSSTTSGKWDDSAIPELRSSDITTNKDQEVAYFKKIGDMSVDTDENFYNNQLYNTELVKPQLTDITGSISSEVVAPASGKHYDLKNEAIRTKRVNRNDNITYLTANDAEWSAVRPMIKYYDFNTFSWSTTTKTILKGVENVKIKMNQRYTPIDSMYRFDEHRQAHHISEIRLTQPGGSRYIYGIPVYNKHHHESSFAVNAVGNNATGLVKYNASENSDGNKSGLDNMYSKTETPPYAYSYLLTEVLSADYADSDGMKGPTDGDLGNYTKFNYSKLDKDYQWRTPVADKSYMASYNPGLVSDKTDDKGSIVYGTKEIWYVHSIETRTHIAEFYTEDRADGLGVTSEDGAIGGVKQKLLRKIVLYSKADKKNGISTPVKTVHFEYTYELCPGTPNSSAKAILNVQKANGKLTLKRVWFTYGNSKKGGLNPYVFEYPTSNALNPAYSIKAYDRWGNYKPDMQDGVPNAEFPYTPQIKADADKYASVYNLKSILTPTGGKINVYYEADDYAYVQDKQAMRMFKVFKGGNYEGTGNVGGDNGTLYEGNTDETSQYTKIKIDLGEGFTDADVSNAGEASADDYFRKRYLAGIDKMYFNFKITVIKAANAEEFVSGYADIKKSECTVYKVGTRYIYAKIALEKHKYGNDVTGRNVNDIVKNAWLFAKMNLGRQLMGSKKATDNGFAQIAGALLGAVTNIIKTISGFPNYMMVSGNGRYFDVNSSYVRLNEPDFIKIGGGYRVKAVVMQDQWKGMTASANDETDAFYGQYYNYTKKQGNSIISSGVALYEPILGGEENPFRYPIYKQESSNWFTPVKESFIDGPYGESFFPGAGIGYSKVTVTPVKLKSLADINSPVSNSTGAVVHEFYTAKDFPTRVSQTDLENQRLNVPGVDIFMLYFKLDMIALTQGYMVELNDMHGKQKSQMVLPALPAILPNTTSQPQDYANAESKDAISKVMYYYKQDPKDRTKIANNITVISPDMTVEKKDLGVDVDVVHDQRFNDYTSGGGGIELNLKLLLLGVFPVLVPTAWPDVKFEYSRNKSLVTTKVVNRYAIMDSTVATDNGSTISTKNLAWDKVTGQPILTSTINEFHDNIYNFTYPAHWSYDRMKMAGINEGMVFSGPVISPDVAGKLIDGDEVSIVTSELDYAHHNVSGSYIVRKDPATSQIKYYHTHGPERIFNPLYAFTGKVIRSANRNMQSTPVGNVTTMTNPIKTSGNTAYLAFDNVLNAGATEFKSSWKYFCNCPGDNDATIDPYAKGYKGMMRPWRSHTYLTARTQNKNNNQLNIRRDGVFAGNFVPFWQNAAQLGSLSTACITPPSTYVPVPAAGGLSPVTSVSGYLCTPWQYVTEITNYNPMGMEIENKDALGRFSMAQFGYGRVLPVATSNNSQYRESAFDGFEDYGFLDCRDDHFSWRSINGFKPEITSDESHTGLKSYKVKANTRIKLSKILSSPCTGGTTGTGTGTSGTGSTNQQ